MAHRSYSKHRPSYPKLPGAHDPPWHDYNANNRSQMSSPNYPYRRSSGGQFESPASMENNPRKRAVNAVRGDSPPEKRSRYPPSGEAPYRAVPPNPLSGPIASNTRPTHVRTSSGTSNTTGPARRDSTDSRYNRSTPRAHDATIGGKTQSIGGVSSNTNMSPMSMHGEIGPYRSGNSTPVQGASTASKETIYNVLNQIGQAWHANATAETQSQMRRYQGTSPIPSALEGIKASHERKVDQANVHWNNLILALQKPPEANSEDAGRGGFAVNQKNMADVVALKIEVAQLKDQIQAMQETAKQDEVAQPTLDQWKLSIESQIASRDNQLRESIEETMKATIKEQIQQSMRGLLAKEDIEKSQNSLKRDIKAVEEQLNKKITTAENQSKIQIARTDKIDRDYGSLSSKLSSVENNEQKTRSKITKLETDVHFIKSQDYGRTLEGLSKSFVDFENFRAKESVKTTHTPDKGLETRLLEANTKLVRQIESQLKNDIQQNKDSLSSRISSIRSDLERVSHAHKTSILESTGGFSDEIQANKENIALLNDALRDVDEKHFALQTVFGLFSENVPQLMQKLMATQDRSVKEASDQRSHGVDQSLEALRADVASLKERSVQKEIDELKTSTLQNVEKIKTIQQEARRFDEAIRNNASSIIATQQNLSIIKTALRNLETRYENISTERLYQQMTHWFQQTYPDNSPIQNKLVELQRRLTQIQQDFAKIDGNAESVTNRLSELGEDVFKTSISVNALENSMNAKIESEIELRIQGDADRLGSVNDLEPRVEKLEQRTTLVETKAEAAQTEALVLKESISKANEVLDLRGDINYACGQIPHINATQGKMISIIRDINLNSDRPLEGLDFDPLAN